MYQNDETYLVLIVDENDIRITDLDYDCFVYFNEFEEDIDLPWE